MCGRYLLDIPGRTLATMLNAVHGADHLGPTWNAAPGQLLPIVGMREGSGELVLEAATWGLVPPWARTPNRSWKPLINARSETVTKKPSFRSALNRGRVAVPATGFYEWQKASGKKIPHLFTLAQNEGAGDPEPFFMAGIADGFIDDDGIPSVTYAILTTEPNELVAPVHDRMPVILPRDRITDWIGNDADGVDAALKLVASYPADAMTSWIVSTDVGSAANNFPELAAPATLL